LVEAGGKVVKGIGSMSGWGVRKVTGEEGACLVLVINSIHWLDSWAVHLSASLHFGFFFYPTLFVDWSVHFSSTLDLYIGPAAVTKTFYNSSHHKKLKKFRWHWF